MTTPAEFRIVGTDDIPPHPGGRGGAPRSPRWSAICEAALSNPGQAVRVDGLTLKEAKALRQQQCGKATAYSGRVKVARRLLPDGTYSCWVTAVTS